MHLCVHCRQYLSGLIQYLFDIHSIRHCTVFELQTPILTTLDSLNTGLLLLVTNIVIMLFFFSLLVLTHSNVDLLSMA